MNKQATATLAATTLLVSGVAAAAPAQAATATVSYAAHVAGDGWLSTVSDGATAGTTGEARRMEALKVTTSGMTMAGHVSGIGWQSTVTAPATVGTTGQSRRLEAVRLKSTISGVTVKCQAHVESYGWMTPVGDGEVCGTTGKGLRMEAVRIWLVSDASTTATQTRTVTTDGLNVRSGPSTSNAIVGSLGLGDTIKGYPYDASWFKITEGTYAGRYVSLSYTKLATGDTTTPLPAPSGTYAPGTTISPSVSQQVIVSTSTSDSSGTNVWYEWDGSSWIKKGSAGATYGYNGLRSASTRVEGDGTTPSGTFGFVMEFGTSNINTKMPFKIVDTCAYWDSYGPSSTYNRYYSKCDGPKNGSSVYLMKYVTNTYRQYEHAAVIDFNYASPIRPPAQGSGSGVMLHYEPAGVNTTGCVGVTDRTALLSILKWLDASKNPKVVVKKA